MWLTIAWSLVVLAGYVLRVWLARYFGPSIYGIYGLIITILFWFEVFVNNGIPYAVSKFVSGQRKKANNILWTGGRIQCIVALIIFIIAFLSAPFLAKIYKNSDLTNYLRVASIDILIYGFYHLLASYQNGLQKYKNQAIIYVTYVCTKLGCVIVLVSLLDSLYGAIFANIIGSVVGFIIGYVLLTDRKPKATYQKRELIEFTKYVVLYFIVISLLLSLDLWVVNYYLSNEASGNYFAAAAIAQVPYFVFLGISATLLPALSAELSNGNMSKAEIIIKDALKYFLIFSIPLGLLISFYANNIVVFIYSELFIDSGDILIILVWGIILVTLLYILTNIINADHRPRTSLIIVLISVIFDFILNVILVPQGGVRGAAISTTIAAGLGVSIAFIIVLQKFRLLWDKRFFIHFTLGVISILVTTYLLKFWSGHFLISIVISGILYMGIMLLSKEINIKDFYIKK